MTRVSRSGSARCEVRRVLDAARERVYAVWTGPAFAKRWSWGRNYDTVSLDIDCRVGGLWTQVVRNRETGEEWRFRGQFREVVPARRLVHTFHWTSDRGTDEGESVVAIDFLTHGSRTEVVIVHTKLPSEEQRDGTARGWLDVLDCVEQCLP